MAAQKKQKIQFRYYEIPANTYVLPLIGQKWIQNYGNDVDSLHFHNHLEIGYCYAGRGNVVLDEKTMRFGKDMFTFIPPNFPHTTTSDIDDISSWEFLFIDVEEFLNRVFPDSPRKVEELCEIIYSKAYFFAKEEKEEMNKQVLTILTEAREKHLYFQQRIEAALMVILVDIIRLNDKREKNRREHDADGLSTKGIRPALDYISREYASEIKICDLADECCISETHFRRLFLETMHMTPTTYLNSVRIHMACAMLKKTDQSIRDIAIKLGFPTMSTFDRNFRKMLGVSPYEWRNNPENYERKLLNYNIKTYEGW